MSAFPASNGNRQQELIEVVSALVNKLTGVQLGPKQSAMVQSRIAKRMLELGISSPEGYLDHLNAHQEKESKVLVSILTTHHTYFFREYAHFEFLETKGLQAVVDALRSEGRKHLKIWSAACSMGQEMYSLSMFLAHHMKRIAPDFTYEIFGSDIDPESVNVARNGVYRWDEIKEIPAVFLSNHWVRGTEEIAAFAKAKPSIKTPLNFGVVNLNELEKDPNKENYDIIFCRNVLIYFNQEQIQAIIKNLLKRLNPKGYMFLGISESLMGLNLPVSFVGPSIYMHKATHLSAVPTAAKSTGAVATTARPQPAAGTSVPAELAAQQAPVAQRKVRVLCVDDSPVILSMMKKILHADNGFEIVATAGNGLQAADALRKHKVDVITLDIHMPEQTGLEFLQKSYNRSSHPPVVMVTSVSREDSTLGLKCLEAGAKDFVEKPGLSNLDERADEIRMKLRCAVQATQAETQGMVSVAKSFARNPVILNPERKLRIVVAGLGDREKVARVLREFQPPQVATIVLFHGAEALISGLIPSFGSSTWKEVAQLPHGHLGLKHGQLLLGDFSKSWDEVRRAMSGKRCSVVVFGDTTKDMVKKLGECAPGQLMLEELPLGGSDQYRILRAKATEVFPATSFAYVSDQFLSKDI